MVKNIDIETHPCFSDDCMKYERMHLPIAPKCNIQCNYCLRKYDCANENRPGISTKVIGAKEAVEKFIEAKRIIPNLNIIGIAGPGDALANWEVVREALIAIKKVNNNVKFCLSTNGLKLPEHIDEFKELGIKFLTVTINAMEADIGQEIYKFVNLDGKLIRGKEAFNVLHDRQIEGVRKAVKSGIYCKINSVYIPELNEKEIIKVSEFAKESGCYIQNILGLIPLEGTKFEEKRIVTIAEINAIRKRAGKNILQMKNCQKCRADAVGTLKNDISQRLYHSRKNTKSKI